MEEKLYEYLDRLKERYPVVAFVVDVIEVYLDRRVSRREVAAGILAAYET